MVSTLESNFSICVLYTKKCLFTFYYSRHILSNSNKLAVGAVFEYLTLLWNFIPPPPPRYNKNIWHQTDVAIFRERHNLITHDGKAVCSLSSRYCDVEASVIVSMMLRHLMNTEVTRLLLLNRWNHDPNMS